MAPLCPPAPTAPHYTQFVPLVASFCLPPPSSAPTHRPPFGV